jgi:phage terminase large subunit
MKVNPKIFSLFYDLNAWRKNGEMIPKHKPIKVIIGGRDSCKSTGLGDIGLMKMQTEGADIYCLREFQESLSESVHRVFVSGIRDRLKLPESPRQNPKCWTILENKVIAPNGAQSIYKGAARNPENIKSAHEYKYSWFEEAEKASQDSIDILLPTIIRNPGAECWFSANPLRSSDPFSQRFIIPFLKILNRDGYYEDDLHLIVKTNWRDNPWYDENTEKLRQYDYQNLSRARYNWIWEGEFYDGIEDSLIMPEWFDACIDAHKRLGFEPRGVRMASHDPSDTGDPKGYAFRHGSVVLDVQEMTTGDVNEGCDWACKLAIDHKADAFTWDCDGLGVSLKRQVADYFAGHNVLISQYKGSESPDFPDAVYEPVEKRDDINIQDQGKNKNVFKNKRAQYYVDLRDKMHRTYEAVILKKYHDPDKMISFDSGIRDLTQLRSEICSMPIKPNRAGLIELYTKEEMISKFKLASPNLADSVKMLGRVPKTPIVLNVKRPPIIRPMGQAMDRRMLRGH